jgi:two-component system cell cycle sensor histidine kinase/response regulator CckA
MVYGTVRQHGGHLLVDSVLGEGTTFWLFLPALDAIIPAQPVVTGETMAVTGGAETILLVEDEPEVRTLASRILRGRGYHVIEAANGEDAITMLHEGQLDHIDLLVTDLIMPRVGGAELIAVMRRVKPGLPVLLASGYSRTGVPEYLFGQPHTAFIEKPFDGATLLNTVRALADGVVPRPVGPAGT